jgi:hypothetical protein
MEISGQLHAPAALLPRKAPPQPLHKSILGNNNNNNNNNNDSLYYLSPQSILQRSANDNSAHPHMKWHVLYIYIYMYMSSVYWSSLVLFLDSVCSFLRLFSHLPTNLPTWSRARSLFPRSLFLYTITYSSLSLHLRLNINCTVLQSDLWNLTPCSLVDKYQRFGGKCRHCLDGRCMLYAHTAAHPSSVVACSELGNKIFLLPWFLESIWSDTNIRTHMSSSWCINSSHWCCQGYILLHA